MKWTGLTMGYIAAVVLGFVLGHQWLARQVDPVIRSYQQILEHPMDACRVLLQPYMQAAPDQNGAVAPIQSPQQAAPQPQPKAPAEKGNNGKH